MKRTLTTKIKCYYRKVRRIIPKKYPHRQEILSSIYQDISSYAMEHPDITYEDLINHFGTPEDMALSFAEMLSPTDVMEISLKTKKRNIIIIIILIIAFLLFFIMICYDNWLAENTIVEIEETTVIYPEVEVEDEDSILD